MKDWLSQPIFWIILTLFSGAGVSLFGWLARRSRKALRASMSILGARVKAASAESLKQAEFFLRVSLQIVLQPSQSIVLCARDFNAELALAGILEPIPATNIHRRFEFHDNSPNLTGNEQTLKIQGTAEFRLIAHFMHDVVPESRSHDAFVKVSARSAGEPQIELSAKTFVPRQVIDDIVRWETAGFPEIPKSKEMNTRHPPRGRQGNY